MSTQLETPNAETLHHQALQESARSETGRNANHRALTLRSERQAPDAAGKPVRAESFDAVKASPAVTGPKGTV